MSDFYLFEAQLCDEFAFEDAVEEFDPNVLPIVGPAGPQGPQGPTGPAGGVSSVDGQTGDVHILPTGGAAGQVLKKQSAADYDVDWDDETGGGGDVTAEDVGSTTPPAPFVLSVSEGGTGANNAADARANLGIDGSGGGVMYYPNQTVNVATNAEIFRITDSNITTQTVVVEVTFAGIVSGVTWTSYDGYIAFYGTCATATTANVTLSNVKTPSPETPLAIANGGTGASTAEGALANLGAAALPTFIYYETTTTSNTLEVKYPSSGYTVHGDGFVICNGYVRTDTTSDTGTAHAIVEHTVQSTETNYYRAWNMYRLQTAQGLEIGVATSAAFTVSSGDTVDFLLGCSKNGTKRIRYTILCFGCTLS